MNRLEFVVTALLLGVAPCWAVAGQTQQEFDPGLPPPGIHDPGVEPRPASDTKADDAREQALPSDVIPHEEAPPTVNVRRQGTDIIQEYSHGGQIYMIKVIPARGVPQTYRDTDGDGSLNVIPGQAPVSPIYYTLYEWGNPESLPEAESAANTDRKN